MNTPRTPIKPLLLILLGASFLLASAGVLAGNGDLAPFSRTPD